MATAQVISAYQELTVIFRVELETASMAVNVAKEKFFKLYGIRPDDDVTVAATRDSNTLACTLVVITRRRSIA